MKRFWSAAVVVCLLLALAPAVQAAPMDLGQEVVAFVAHGSVELPTVAVTGLTPMAAATTTLGFFATTNAQTRAVESARPTTDPPPNSMHATLGTGHARPRQLTSGGYDVLKEPDARGTR